MDAALLSRKHVDENQDVEMEQSTSLGCRVYVGNLSWSIKHQDLKDHMQAAGPVEFATVLEWNGRSKVCISMAILLLIN